AVNLASRLEGVNKEYGSNVIISDSTLELVREAHLISHSGADTNGSAAAIATNESEAGGGGVATAVATAELTTVPNSGHEFMVRSLDFIAVKGKTEPVKIYELVGV